MEHSAEMHEPAEAWTAELCCSLTSVGTAPSKLCSLGAVPETDKPQVLFSLALGRCYSNAAELTWAWILVCVCAGCRDTELLLNSWQLK